MFFSPLHTPQNWQIAARRREIYQWSFIAPCYITMYDLSVTPIQDMVDNFNNQKMTYIQNEKNEMKYTMDIEDKYIQNGFGKIAKIDKATKRYTKKKANKIKALGVAEDIMVTDDHNCMIIKKENVDCHKAWNSKKCVCNYNASMCQKLGCSEYKNKEYKISKIKARNVKKGDYVLIPFNKEVKESVIKNEDQARFAGHLASDGNILPKWKTTRIFMNKNEKDDVYPCVQKVFNDFGSVATIREKQQVLTVASSRSNLFAFSDSLVKNKGKDKKFTAEVTLLDPKLQLHVLGAYIQSDGHYNKTNKCVEITTYSMHLANQLINMCYRCNILARVNKQPISRSRGTFNTSNKYRYIINISSSECYKIKDYVPGKIKENNFKNKGANKRFFWNNYVVSPVVSNKSFDYEGYVYDIREPETNTVTANGIGIYQCRFYYSNEPKVAAGVDFYCFTPNNKVLMEDGTERCIYRIKEGDEVVTGDGSIKKVLKVHKRYIEEDILKIRVGGINRDIEVTVNHEIPRISQKNWVESDLTTPSERRKKERIKKYGNKKLEKIWDIADTLEIGDRLHTPKTKLGNGYRTEELDNDVCYVLGAFLAEGSYYWYDYKEKKRYPKAVRFSIHEDELDNYGKKIIEIINKKYGLKSKIYHQNNEKCIDVVCFNVDFAKFVYDIVGSGSKTKYIHKDFINNANKDQLLSFLCGYIDGDGYFDINNQGCQIVTSSDILSSQIPYILEKLGISFCGYGG